MDTSNAGASLHDDDEAARREAARLMGSVRSERKAAAVRENGKKGGAHEFTEATRAKLRDAQAARRERERQEREAAEVGIPPAPKAKRGRPRKQQAEGAAGE